MAGAGYFAAGGRAASLLGEATGAAP